MQVIYILTNEAMPGYIKIGKTKSNLNGRIRQLDTTGLPLPFECFYAARVDDCDAVEKLLHDAFADSRTRKNREFFQINPERVASALKLATIEEITPRESVFETNEDRVAVETAKSRRSPFNFKSVNISVGQVLHLAKNTETTCKVLDHKRVEFREETMSLSQAALIAINELGYNWKAVSGPDSWSIDGITLDEIRRQVEDD